MKIIIKTLPSLEQLEEIGVDSDNFMGSFNMCRIDGMTATVIPDPDNEDLVLMGIVGLYKHPGEEDWYQIVD